MTPAPTPPKPKRKPLLKGKKTRERHINCHGRVVLVTASALEWRCSKCRKLVTIHDTYLE